MEKSKDSNPLGPVIVTTSVLLVVLYSVFKRLNIPCKNTNLVWNFVNTFNHNSNWHLISNLASLLVLMSTEKKEGSLEFLIVMLILVFLTSVTETVIALVLQAGGKEPVCVKGFSAVILGLTAYYIVRGDFKTLMLISLLLSAVLPAFYNKKIAWLEHLTGIFLGLVLGIISKFAFKSE